MELTYLGKKDAVTIGKPFLSREYTFHKNSGPVPAADYDAQKLMEVNPRMFSSQPDREVKPVIQEEDSPVERGPYSKTALTRMKKEEILQALADIDLVYEEDEFTRTDLIQFYVDATTPEEIPEAVEPENVPEEGERSEFE